MQELYAKNQRRKTKMKEEEELKVKKGFLKNLADLLGDFLVFITLCVTIISFFVCLAFIVMTLFENPVSLAIVSTTLFLIIAWSLK